MVSELIRNCGIIDNETPLYHRPINIGKKLPTQISGSTFFRISDNQEIGEPKK